MWIFGWPVSQTSPVTLTPGTAERDAVTHVRMSLSGTRHRPVAVAVTAAVGLVGAAWAGTADVVVGVLAAASCLAFVVTGYLLLHDVQRRANAWLCFALAVLGPLATVSEQTGLAGQLVSALGSFVFVPLAWLLLQYPGNRLPGWVDRLYLVVLAGACGQSLESVVVSAWGPDIPDEVARANDRVLEGMLVALLVAIAALPILVARKLLATRGLPRVERVPIAVTSLVVALSLVIPELVAQMRPAGAAPRWVPYLLFFLVPLAFLTVAVLHRLARGRVVEAVLTSVTGSGAESSGLRQALRRALADPTLEIHYWAREIESYVDPQGQPASHAASALLADVRDSQGEPLVRLVTDPGLQHHRDLLDAAVRAAALALEKERLAADLRAAQQQAGAVLARLRDSEASEHRLSTLLPSGVAAHLRADPAALTRTEKLTVTVLMTDVRGWTTIAEKTEPVVLARLLQEHRQAVNEVVHGHGGVVMQYVGDAVMAVFGAPRPDPANADRALRSAAQVHLAQSRLDSAWAAMGALPFGLGIGVHTGEVAAAYLGGSDRREYTLVGDTVNVAARLCHLARPAGTTVASAATLQAAGADDGWEALGPLTVRNREAPILAFKATGVCADPSST